MRIWKSWRAQMAITSVIFFAIGFVFARVESGEPVALFKGQMQTAMALISYAEANQISLDPELLSIMAAAETNGDLRLANRISDSVNDLITRMDAELKPGDTKFEALVKEFEIKNRLLKRRARMRT